MEVKPTVRHRVVRLFTSARPFACRRCGWKALKKWTDDEVQELKYFGDGGGVNDPSLISLDKGGTFSWKRRANKLRDSRERFDVDLASIDSKAGAPAFEVISPAPMRRTRRRRKRSRRSEVVAAGLLSLLVMTAVMWFLGT